MIRSTTAAVAALFLMGFVFTVPSMSLAKGGSGTVTTQVRAELVPCCADPEPEPNAHGRADRKIQSKSGAVKSDLFRAKVEIPVPSGGPGITDPTTADIRLVLSRASVDYAECFLVLDDDSIQAKGDDDDADGAEFQVKIQLRVKNATPVVKSVKGQCDVDLVTPDVQAGLPDVKAGDVATVTSDGTPFLQGTFVQR